MEKNVKLTGNKLIAEFMGWKTHKRMHYILQREVIEYNQNLLIEPYCNHNDGYIQEGGELFDNSWDWLMPVIEKIENLENYRFDITIRQETITILDKDKEEEIYCFFGEGESKLEIVYKAVIEFIKWYNENK